MLITMNNKLINVMILITQLLIVTLAVLNVYTWFNKSYNPSGLGFFLADRIRANPEFQILSIKSGFLCALLSTIPIILLITILHKIKVFYTSVIEMKIFSLANVRSLKKISLYIFSWVVIDFLSVPLTSYLLTLNNPPGDRLIMISLSWGQVMGLYFSGFVFIFTNILKNGFNIKNDIDSII
ncbi:hypothetical protein C5471_03835 [Photorhabdus tasmaniensis]|uniref:DUF2975 domain-containing protein n=2 Tax=Photorhabdus tasmaniensis TaxID=1004159 RepID=A0ABX0GDU2_9GAMM|nr:hypothetical protein [Photorhabdus tasmaniensis]